MIQIPPRPTVLIVEDDNLVRMDTADLFTDAGFTVMEAWTGAMAVLMLEEYSHIRLVFTDVQMPGRINGIELARMLAERWPGTGVMVCSGSATPKASQLPPKVT